MAQPLTDTMELPCLLKVGDNITTDHIMPAGSKILPYRSNIPHLANYCFEVWTPNSPARHGGRGRLYRGRRQLWPGLQP